MGGWSAASGRGGGQIAAGGDGDFALGIMAVSGLPAGLVEGCFGGADAASSGIRT